MGVSWSHDCVLRDVNIYFLCCVCFDYTAVHMVLLGQVCGVTVVSGCCGYYTDHGRVCREVDRIGGCSDV